MPCFLPSACPPCKEGIFSLPCLPKEGSPERERNPGAGPGNPGASSHLHGMGCFCLPCTTGMQTGGSTVSLGTLGPAVCSLTSLLSGAVPGTAGSASVRVASLSSLSWAAPGLLSLLEWLLDFLDLLLNVFLWEEAWHLLALLGLRRVALRAFFPARRLVLVGTRCYYKWTTWRFLRFSGWCNMLRSVSSITLRFYKQTCSG